MNNSFKKTRTRDELKDFISLQGVDKFASLLSADLAVVVVIVSITVVKNV